MITAKTLLAYLLQTATAFGTPIHTADINPEEAFCLAQNVFYEARGEDLKGQFAVASVTLNRANDPRYPDTICGVVQQSGKARDNKRVCAFSWYCDKTGKGREIPVRNRDGSVNTRVADQFQMAAEAALSVMSGSVADVTNGATHFHNRSVKPSWASRMKRTVSIDNHTFYKQR